jgi:type I restriction enzyme S subunit
MKEGWTYKKLGEICDIISGKNQRTVENPDGLYPIMGSGGVMGYADDYLCKEGTTIIGRKGTINRPIYVEQKFWNVDTAFGLQPKDVTNSKFLFYLCKSINFERYDKSVTIPSLVKSDLLKINVYVPETQEQQLIVSELDLLSDVIEKKKTQIEEFDKLTQSIFFDMFGDPVTNEKGWETKKLGEVVLFMQGEQVPVGKQSDTPKQGYIRFLRIIDFTQGNDAPRYIKHADDNHVLHEGEIAIVRYGSPGFVCYNKYGVIANNLFKVVPVHKDIFIFQFLISWFESGAFQNKVRANQYGAALQAIKFGTIKPIPIIIPPLALQQAFAAKVEAIEQMKAKVRQSLKESEELFNSRMDYYFN